MVYILLAIAFCVSSTAFANKPNYYDPLEESGILNFSNDRFYVNGLELKLGSLENRVADFNGDGVVDPFWVELWSLRGRWVTVRGYRDSSPDEYDSIYVVNINGFHYPNYKVRR